MKQDLHRESSCENIVGDDNLQGSINGYNVNDSYESLVGGNDLQLAFTVTMCTTAVNM